MKYYKAPKAITSHPMVEECTCAQANGEKTMINCNTALSYRITEKQYNYLLPVPAMRPHLHKRVFEALPCETYFIGDKEQFQDMMHRCIYLD